MNPTSDKSPRAPGKGLGRQILFTVAAFLLLTHSSLAATPETSPPGPAEGTVIQAEGEARAKVANDLLSIELTLEKESALTPQLHEEMQQQAAKALDQAKKHPGVEVKTLGYTVYPIYDRGHIVRQHATYRLSLESKDFAAALSLAAALQPFQVGNLVFSVSPERGKATEKSLLEEAIADLRDNIGIAANSLGAKSIRITHITIGSRQDHFAPQPQMMREALDMAATAPAPVAAEAGESQVSVTVSGAALVK